MQLRSTNTLVELELHEEKSMKIINLQLLNLKSKLVKMFSSCIFFITCESF